MPRYEYDDEDVYDDEYDEEYYEEEEEEYVDTTPSSATAAKTTATTTLVSPSSPTTAAAAPTKDSFGILFEEVDYDILASVFGPLRTKVGPMIPVDSLIEQLRESNYDVDSVVHAIQEKKKAASPGGRGLVVQAAMKTPSPADSSAANSSMGTPQTSTASPTVPPVNAGLIVPKKSTASFLSTEAAEDKDGRKAVTIVITGHVDSGKSTILGHLLLQMGRFTHNEVAKNEKAGESMKKQSFKYAWLLDQSEEERRRGVTIDAGSQTFLTATKRVSVLDCPGHQDYIMNMISSATQADAAVLVLPAQRGEFESGLQHGTREHIQVLHILGIKTLIIAINKIDVIEGGPEAVKERMDTMMEMLEPLLVESKFAMSDVTHVVPVSGLQGFNLAEINSNIAPWYKGPSLCGAIDALPVGGRLVKAPLRISVSDVSKGVIYGRVESGKVKKGAVLVFQPTNVKIPIKGISLQSSTNSEAVTEATAGTLIEITTNAETATISVGDVGCDAKGDVVPVSTKFSATVQLFPGSEKAMLPGSEYSLGLQSLTTTVTVEKLLSRQKEDGTWTKGMVKCVSPGHQANVVLRLDRPTALELALNVKALGCFVLRQEGKTVGGGIVTDILPWSRE